MFVAEYSEASVNLLSHIRDERLRRAFLYWEERRGGRLAPSRADLDPTDIPNLLPHLMLVEVPPGAGQLRYRLVGTEVERNFGISMTGRHIDEVMRGRYLEFISGLYRQVIESCTPIYSENTFSDPDSRAFLQGWPLRTARVMLPLTSNGASVDMIMIAQVFFRDTATAERTVIAAQDHFSIGEDAALVVQPGDPVPEGPRSVPD
jgi:hypothetical protein